MKGLILLLLAVCLMLTACRGLYPTEYLYQAEHEAPYAVKEVETTIAATEPPLPIAADYYELRDLIRSFVLEGTEHGQIRISSYTGDLEQDLRRVTRYLTDQDPISSYATDYISCEREETEEGWMIQVDAVYRRSANEIASIRSVRGREAALQAMYFALRELQSSVTLQISGYVREDFVAALTNYCLQHPDDLPEVPTISVSIYPDNGNVRVVEVHFVYQNDKETLRGMKAEIESNLSAAYNYIRYSRSDQQKLQLLYSYFINRFSYTAAKSGVNPYTLLCQGISDSRSFASVVSYLCSWVGIDSRLVRGHKDGLVWYWNVVCLEDRWVHLDYQTDVLAGDGLHLYSDLEMVNYSWDLSEVPACEPALPEVTDASETGTNPVPETGLEPEPVTPPETTPSPETTPAPETIPAAEPEETFVD